MAARKASDKSEPPSKSDETASAEEPPAGEARPQILEQIQGYLRALRHEAVTAEPLIGKLTSKQIDKILNQIAAKAARESRDRRLTVCLGAAVSTLGIIAFCFLWAFSLSCGNTSLMVELIKMVEA